MPFLRTLLALCLCVALGQAAQLRTLGGKTIEGELVEVTEKTVVVKTDDGPVSTPVADVLNLDLNAPESLAGLRFVDVQLTDGSLLHCSQFALKGNKAEVTVLPNHKVEIPVSAIHYYLAGASEAAVRKQWQEFLGKQQGNRDILAVKRGDVLNGLEGTFGPGDDKGETIEFELSSGKKFPIGLDRIHGMIFYHRPAANPPETVCKVTDTNRNLLMAQKVSVGEDGCTIETVSGLKLTYPATKLVSRLDFSKDKLAFLSDLEPAQLTVSNAEDRFELIRKDKNLDDGPLRLAGGADVYGKGLILFPRTVAVYELGGEYKDFKFVLGTDAQASPDSPLRIVIDGDGRELLAADIKPGDEPQAFNLSVQGVKQLRLTVSTELLDFGSHVVLANAQVSK